MFKSEHIIQWEDGLLTDAEVLMKIMNSGGIRQIHDELTLVITTMLRHQLEDKRHFYYLQYHSNATGMWLSYHNKNDKLLLCLLPKQAEMLNQLLGPEYRFHSKMAERIRKIDEEKDNA